MVDLAEVFNNRFFGVETLIMKIGGGEEEEFLLKIQKNLLFENLEPYLAPPLQAALWQKRPKSAVAIMREREKSIEQDGKDGGWRNAGGVTKMKRRGRREGEVVSPKLGRQREKEGENSQYKGEKIAQEKKGVRVGLVVEIRDQGKRRVGTGVERGRSEGGGGERGGVGREREKIGGEGDKGRERNRIKEGGGFDEVRDILLKIRRNLK